MNTKANDDLIKAILKKLFDLETERAELNKVLERYRKTEETTIQIIPSIKRDSLDPNFPKNQNNTIQIIWLMRREKRFLFTPEIAKRWAPYIKDNTILKITQWVSSCLSREHRIKKYCSDLVFINLTAQKRDRVWGFSDWLDENGKIKPDYRNIRRNDIK